jgi:hypothetical protein
MVNAVNMKSGYGEDLYKVKLTSSSSSSYDDNVEGKISIKDTGEVELSIKNLRSYPDNQLTNQNSVLVIETEINDNPKTYSKSFSITDGKAELEFTLDGLIKDDKLEIVSVSVNKETTATPTPTINASPTPDSSPIVIASPTPASSPTVSNTPTPVSSPSTLRVLHISDTTSDTILIPGGIISETTTATPTPVASPSVTPVVTASPTATPGVIEADVSIKPETINLKSKGKFKAFIELPSTYDVNDIDPDTVTCEGTKAIRGKAEGDKYVATFNVQDLGFDIKIHKGRDDKKVRVELTVSGELEDGTKFEGSDTVEIKDK